MGTIRITHVLSVASIDRVSVRAAMLRQQAKKRREAIEFGDVDDDDISEEGFKPRLKKHRKLVRDKPISQKLYKPCEKPVLVFDERIITPSVKEAIEKYQHIREVGINLSTYAPDEIMKDVDRLKGAYFGILDAASEQSKYNHKELPLNWRLLTDETIDKIVEECIKRCGIDDPNIPVHKKIDFKEFISKTWSFHARQTQLPPEMGWVYYLYLAGRSVGKTTAAMQWALSVAIRYPGCRIGLISQTPEEGWKYLIEQTLKRDMPSWINARYNKNDKTVTLQNGSIMLMHSAFNHEKMRGARHHFVVCDELAKWKMSAYVFSQVALTNTLDADPKWGDKNFANRFFISTTPTQAPIITDLLHREKTLLMRETTFDNAEYIPRDSIYELVRENCGTAFGRQELMGEVIEVIGNSVFNMSDIDAARIEDIDPSELESVVVGVDPQGKKSMEEKKNPNETGIVVMGKCSNGEYYVLADYSINGTPDEWVAEVEKAYNDWDADFVVAEINFGYDMAEDVIRNNIRADLPLKLVRASKGKRRRAHGASIAMQQGRLHHVGFFPVLEEQMTTFVGDETTKKGENSPDRMDALVWAFNSLEGISGHPELI